MGKSVYTAIKRKASTFQNNPVGSVKHKPAHWVLWLLNIWAAHKLRQNGGLEVLLDFAGKRPRIAFGGDVIDHWFLYQAVRQRKPRVILEFGSGHSTIALAQALWENQRDSPKSRGYLYSVDADSYWAEATSKAIPTHLQAYCEIFYCPLIEIEYNGTLGFRHANVPHVSPNFLFLDGPALSLERKVAIDVLDIEDKLPSDFYMVIDDRQANTLFLHKYLQRRYKFKKRIFVKTQTFELID